MALLPDAPWCACRAETGRLEVVFLPAPHLRSLSGVLHRDGEVPKVLTGADLEEAVMEAVADEEERIDVDGD